MTPPSKTVSVSCSYLYACFSPPSRMLGSPGLPRGQRSAHFFQKGPEREYCRLCRLTLSIKTTQFCSCKLPVVPRANKTLFRRICVRRSRNGMCLGERPTEDDPARMSAVPLRDSASTPHALGCDLWKFPRCTNIGWPTPEPHSCRSLPGDHTSFLRSHS